MFAAQLDNIVCKEDTALVQAIDFIVCGRRHRYYNAVLYRFFQNQFADAAQVELVNDRIRAAGFNPVYVTTRKR